VCEPVVRVSQDSLEEQAFDDSPPRGEVSDQGSSQESVVKDKHDHGPDNRNQKTAHTRIARFPPTCGWLPNFRVAVIRAGLVTSKRTEGFRTYVL
jgi:hypothetical protein